jgi:amino acid adenylation domain-containing protein
MIAATSASQQYGARDPGADAAQPVLDIERSTTSNGKLQNVAVPVDAALIKALHTAATCLGADTPAAIAGAWGLLLHAYGADEPVRFNADLHSPDGACFTGTVTVPTNYGTTVATYLGNIEFIADDDRDYRYLLSVRVGDQHGCHACEKARGVRWPEDLAGRVAMCQVHLGATGTVSLHYDTARLSPDAADNLTRHLLGMLTRLAEARSDTVVRSLSMLGDEERQRILDEWNRTDVDLGPPTCIHSLVMAQVARTPDAVAIVHPDGELTYGDLGRAVRRLAHRLRELGVKRGDLVAVHLERTPGALVALLATLLAGAAYVPVQPSLPTRRIREVLTIVDASVVIASSTVAPTLLDALPAVGQVRHIVSLDEHAEASYSNENSGVLDWPEKAAGIEVEPWSVQAAGPDLAVDEFRDTARPGDLAYVIFTSGSTGTPKGVMMQHAPVTNVVRWVNRTFEISAADQMLFITSFAFDLSVYDIFGILAAGASIRMASDSEVSDPQALLNVIISEPITFWDSAPAAMQQLFPLINDGIVSRTLRLIFLSGDWVPLWMPEALWARFPSAEVVALGGATEAAVWSNYHRVTTVEPEWVSIPYGRPIANARYYVLDECLEPVPIGVEGDLYIGGSCLAAGYYRDEIMTHEKFTENPFEQRPGARLYHTGDRACWRPGGTMEFRGRQDTQVKVRGYRVELGEIEARLGQMRDVAAAAVLLNPGEELVAFLVAEPGRSIDPSSTRASLADQLPSYMVPARVIVIPGLPATANGKLDRHALARQAKRTRGSVNESPAEPEAPSTPTESTVAQVWAKVLGGDLSIQRRDEFFDLGGHSLLVTRVIGQLRKRLGISIPVRLLMDHSTLADFAHELDRLAAAAGNPLPHAGRIPEP